MKKLAIILIIYIVIGWGVVGVCARLFSLTTRLFVVNPVKYPSLTNLDIYETIRGRTKQKASGRASSVSGDPHLQGATGIISFVDREFPHLSSGELSAYWLRLEKIVRNDSLSPKLVNGIRWVMARIATRMALDAFQRNDVVTAEKNLVKAHGYLTGVFVPLSDYHTPTLTTVNCHILYHEVSDKLAAIYIASGRGKYASNILLDIIKRDAIYDDNGIIKGSPFRAYVDSIRCSRYLSTVDTISLLIRLGERLKMPEAQMNAMLAPYTGAINNPESFQEYVVTLEYRLTYNHLARVEDLLNKFKRYLHANFGVEKTIKKQYGYLFYYPYLMGRFLLLRGEYDKAAQYLKLASEFRPDYNGVVSCDLVDAYLKMYRDNDAKALTQSLLSSLRYTSEFMFFRSLYHEQYE